MYVPGHFRIDDDAAWRLVEEIAFGHLVTHGPAGFQATPLPLLADPAGAVLRGHVARANGHWRSLDGADAIVVMSIADHYVSPSWYPSKRDEPRVVPTWNYDAVHLVGTVTVHHDPEWLLELVTALTDHHEGGRDPAWHVSDAPADFIDKMVRAVVGVEMRVTGIEGKAKRSQNRSTQDQLAVAEAAPHRNRLS